MNLHVTRRGHGPPVVLTHGFATSSDVWAGQTEALADTHTVVDWDLRGHGRSAPPRGRYTREVALADLASVVALAGAPPLLAGHSAGGYLSLAHGLAHPETVAGLAILSAGPGFRNAPRREAYNRSVEKVAVRSGFPLEVPDAGHDVHLDRPGEVCDALIALSHRIWSTGE